MSVLRNTVTVTIALGASLSDQAVLGEKVLCGIQMPAAWDAADITFQVSYDGGSTWKDLNDDAGNPIKITAPAAGKLLKLDPSDYAPFGMLKVQSGVPAALVNQTAARSITLLTMKYFSLR